MQASTHPPKHNLLCLYNLFVEKDAASGKGRLLTPSQFATLVRELLYCGTEDKKGTKDERGTEDNSFIRRLDFHETTRLSSDDYEFI